MPRNFKFQIRNFLLNTINQFLLESRTQEKEITLTTFSLTLKDPSVLQSRFWSKILLNGKSIFVQWYQKRGGRKLDYAFFALLIQFSFKQFQIFLLKSFYFISNVVDWRQWRQWRKRLLVVCFAFANEILFAEFVLVWNLQWQLSTIYWLFWFDLSTIVICPHRLGLNWED